MLVILLLLFPLDLASLSFALLALAPLLTLDPLALVIRAWRPLGPRSPLVLESPWAWKPRGPGGPVGIGAVQSWRPCGPEALQA